MFMKYGDVRSRQTRRLTQELASEKPQNIIDYALSHPQSQCAWYAPMREQAFSAFREIVFAAGDEVDSFSLAQAKVKLKNGTEIRCFHAGTLEYLQGLLISYLGVTPDVSRHDRLYTDILTRAVSHDGHIYQASTPVEQARLMR